MPDTPDIIQSLYRKYRPQTFEQVRGQAHVARTLTNAVRNGSVAHGYVFAGPRGTGKTSTARILAKALNCVGPDDSHRLTGPTPTPCGVCHSCTEVAAGASLDVIEMDAASNRSIDDVRELRDTVAFAPIRDRYKVYIIDEAHMLTREAFNALLKTLEEPPANVVFVLATTEPHKLPDTIVSRCQRFDFHRPTAPQIVELLAEIAAHEGIDTDEDALETIAEHCAGRLPRRHRRPGQAALVHRRARAGGRRAGRARRHRHAAAHGDHGHRRRPRHGGRPRLRPPALRARHQLHPVHRRPAAPPAAALPAAAPAARVLRPRAAARPGPERRPARRRRGAAGAAGAPALGGRPGALHGPARSRPVGDQGRAGRPSAARAGARQAHASAARPVAGVARRAPEPAGRRSGAPARTRRRSGPGARPRRPCAAARPGPGGGREPAAAEVERQRTAATPEAGGSPGPRRTAAAAPPTEPAAARTKPRRPMPPTPARHGRWSAPRAPGRACWTARSRPAAPWSPCCATRSRWPSTASRSPSACPRRSPASACGSWGRAEPSPRRSPTSSAGPCRCTTRPPGRRRRRLRRRPLLTDAQRIALIQKELDAELLTDDD